MEKYDVIVIGGSASGIVVSTVARKSYPDKKILVIRKEEVAMVPCGIPYLFGSLGSLDKNVVPTKVFESNNIDLLVDEVIDVDVEEKEVSCVSGRKFAYDKLILCLGSVPWVPKSLDVSGLENVFLISKNKDELQKVVEATRNARKIVVVGGGFIGVEVSDELSRKQNKEVVLIEARDYILGTAFDEDIARKAEGILKDSGIDVITSITVSQIVSEGGVAKAVQLSDGRKIEADVFILAMGYRPNTALAERMGLWLNSFSAIRVDEYMRTNIDDVFAVGDCAEKRDFITRRPVPVMLASTACAEGRVAGMNLYKLSTLKVFNGTIAIFSTCIGDTAFASAGLTKSVAEKENFDVVVSDFEGIDRHPGTLPDVRKQFVRLVVSSDNGRIIGAEIVGGKSVGELINMLGVCIQMKMTVFELATIQVGTHPLLTSAPTSYPVVKCAEMAVKKLVGC